MNTKLMIAVIAITLALVFYTVGVFTERKARSLRISHVIIFWLGLVCDTTGTLMMSQIAKNGTAAMSPVGQIIHGVTGLIAIVLMLFHALWATWVLYKNDENKKATFHKLSIVVWLIWLVPYIIGMMMGMM